MNKHISDSLKIDLELNGFEPKEKGKVVELTSKSPFDFNIKENRTMIQTNQKEIIGISSEMEFELNPHSLTILKLSKK